MPEVEENEDEDDDYVPVTQSFQKLKEMWVRKKLRKAKEELEKIAESQKKSNTSQ